MEQISKTQRKRDMHALQVLGEELIELSRERLRLLNLPEPLQDAILEAKRIKAHEGRRRQLQYVGRLMRDIDAAPIAAQLDQWKQPGRAQARLHQQAEQWRAQLLSEPDALAALCAKFPQAQTDRARIGELVRQTHWENEQGKPPKASRALFRAINETLRVAHSTASSSTGEGRDGDVMPADSMPR
jgi:ribosome-associated protein